ncbi:MAG: pirin family protein, partial [Verrucomicrobiales bacterium]
PDGREGCAAIRQDAKVYRVRLEPNATVTHDLKDGRGLWLQVINGPVSINGTKLESGDAASSEEPDGFTIAALEEPVEALLFDLS